MHSEVAKLRREMDALRAQLQAAIDKPCVVIRFRRVAESGEIVTVESGNTAGPGHTCSNDCKALIIGLAEDPEAPDFRERLTKRAAREVQRTAGGAESAASLEQTRRTCAFYGVPFPEAAERPPAGPAPPPPADASPPPEVPEGRPDSPRATGGLVGGAAGLGGGVPAVPASEQIVQMEPPVAPSGLVDCARAYCRHPADEHRGIRIRLPCQACGFRAEDHDPDGFAIEVPQHARRFSACSNYRAIYVDPIDSDRCLHPGCRCTGWRRWLPSDPYDPHETFAAKWAERDRQIAETQRQLDELQARLEAAQRQAAEPNDLGAAPRGCPVYSDEVSR